MGIFDVNRDGEVDFMDLILIEEILSVDDEDEEEKVDYEECDDDSDDDW